MAFSVAGPAAWNNLPTHIQTSETVFKILFVHNCHPDHTTQMLSNLHERERTSDVSEVEVLQKHLLVCPKQLFFLHATGRDSNSFTRWSHSVQLHDLRQNSLLTSQTATPLVLGTSQSGWL